MCCGWGYPPACWFILSVGILKTTSPTMMNITNIKTSMVIHMMAHSDKEDHAG